MPIDVPIRHELKFHINEMQYRLLASALDNTLDRDPNGDKNNNYAIRSLYFDTVFNNAYYDKIDGVQNRNKYRIRIYNYSDKIIKMECKTKLGTLISKRSISIPRELADQLIVCDPTDLDKTNSGLLHDVYREMRLNLLKPVVIVDYVREAYLHSAEDVRITFDKSLKTGFTSHDMFNPFIPTIPCFKNGNIILEIKYNRFLPTYIRDLINYYVQGSTQMAISKYTICRQFEAL